MSGVAGNGVINEFNLYATCLGGRLPQEELMVIRSLPMNSVLSATPRLWLMAWATLGVASLQEVPAQEMRPATPAALTDPAAPALPADSAVEDVSNKPSWFRDLFSKGSPLYVDLTVNETYDDNIFISPKKVSDFLTSIRPSLDFEKGDRTSPHTNYLNVYFAPTFFLYNRNSDQDRQNYNADLYYQYQWTRLTLGVEQSFQHLTDASIDIGGLIERDVYKTALSGNYIYNDSLIVSGDATQVLSSYPTRSSVDTNEWYGEGYALYQLAPKLQLGGGPRIDFIDVEGAPNETHQDLLGKLIYDPDGKISVTFTGGMEYLQFQGTSPSHILPIFELNVNYRPSEQTSVTLSAGRRSLNSYDISGAVYVETSVQLGLRQQVMRDVYLTLGLGYSLRDYEFGSVPLSGLQRSDKYFFANIGLEWDPRDWLKFNAGYSHSKDNSNFETNSFEDNQFDVQSSVQF
jgi:hypothetical protein